MNKKILNIDFFENRNFNQEDINKAKVSKIAIEVLENTGIGSLINLDGPIRFHTKVSNYQKQEEKSKCVKSSGRCKVNGTGEINKSRAETQGLTYWTRLTSL